MKFNFKLVLLGTVFLVNTSAFAQFQLKLTQVQLYNLGVKLGKLEPVNQVPLLYAPATVAIPPDQEYMVSSSQAGLVIQLYVAVGDKVSKGQVLAAINSPELLILQRLFLKAHSNRNLAWANYQRDKKLFDEGVIAERRWQETRTFYQSLVADVNEAQQLLEIAGVTKSEINKLAKSRRLNSTLNISAPISGVILERLAMTGERIDMYAALYRLANLQQLWLQINIPQQYVKNLKSGDKVSIEGSAVEAKISLIGRHVNPKSQTVLVRAVLENNDGSIRAGQSVNSRIIQTSKQAMFRIPNAAIAQRDGQRYIFLRNEAGFNVMPVNIIGKEDDYSVIAGRFNKKQQVAVRGAVALKAKWIGLDDEGDD